VRSGGAAFAAQFNQRQRLMDRREAITAARVALAEADAASDAAEAALRRAEQQR
jgi:hypothetical protein